MAFLLEGTFVDPGYNPMVARVQSTRVYAHVLVA